MENVKYNMMKNTLYFAMESALFGLPGYSLLEEYKQQRPKELQEFTRSLLPKIFSSHHESFPLSGIVSKSGNYYYLNINDEKNYVRSASMILSVSEPDITISPPVGFKKTVIVPP